MQNPLITTIITTFRRPKLLKRAITSAMNQTYSNIRICIYDNASGDETETIVREFIKLDSRINYHRHEQNIGMMKNYQFALSKVNTPLFSILSDDDLLLPHFYKETLEALQKHPLCAFAITSTIVMTPKGNVIKWAKNQKRENFGYLTPDRAALEISKGGFYSINVLFQSWTLEKELLDFSNHLQWDGDFLLQLAMRFPIHVSNNICGIFLRHTNSFSISQYMDDWCLATLKVIDRVKASGLLSQSSQDSIIQALNLGPSYSLRMIASKLADNNIRDATFCLEMYQKRFETNIIYKFLFYLTKLSKHFQAVSYLFSFLRKCYPLFNYKDKKIQKKYSHYSKWLQM